MFQRFHAMRERRDEGFTLIELLVVVLIIAILAAIAIPIFLKQREKAYVADAQSTLHNTGLKADSFATTKGGDYTTVTWDLLVSEEGAKKGADQTVVVTGDTDEYCVVVTEDRLPSGHDWRISSFYSGDQTGTGFTAGAPSDNDACPNFV